MPEKIHFFAHAKHVLSPLPHTQSKHTTCLALQCICTNQTLAPTPHPPTKNTCGPALPPSHPHPTQPAASWLAPSTATYTSRINNGTCRSAPAMAAPPSEPMPLLVRLPYAHPHTAATTHSSPNPRHNMFIQRTQSTPLTHSCLQTYTSLPMPNTSFVPCHIRIQNIPRASHCTA
jgi:hypothetical protein